LKTFSKTPTSTDNYFGVKTTGALPPVVLTEQQHGMEELLLSL
jgi:hypothetical protein